MNSYKVGIESEKKIISYYEKRGYKLLQHRWRTSMAEIDLFFMLQKKKNTSWLMVEVKKIKNENFVVTGLRQAQKKRLAKAFQMLQLDYDPLHFNFVVLDENNKMEIFDEEILLGNP